jgi:hypothetical protein
MTIQQGWMEQRKFERVAASLKVSYRILEEAEKKGILDQPRYNQTTAEQLPHLSQKFHVYHAITRDISLGGMSISGERPFQEGAHVEIFLQMHQYKVTLTLLAVVVRAASAFQSGRTVYTAGVKLLALNREDVSRLERFLLAEKLRQGPQR